MSTAAGTADSGVPSWCREVDTLFLDLDGCTWFGGTLAEGALETVRALRDGGRRVFFVTNVSSATRRGVATKLTRLGLPATPEEIQVPLELVPSHPFLAGGRARVYGLCAAPVHEAMRELGFTVTGDPDRADVVLVGRDPRMTYDDLAAAARALHGGARLLALNLDARVPVEGGRIVPGTGAIVAALREATGAAVESVGKPSSFYFDAALRTFAASPETTAMVGDSLDSDILGGLRAGMRTVHVGGSEYSTRPSPPRPDLRIDRLRDLTAWFT